MHSTDYFRLRITQILLAFLCTNFGGNVYGRRAIDSRSVELQGVAESGNLFAEDLYETFTKPGAVFEDRNVLMSPLSLDIALAMLRAGATGITKKEITRGLRLSGELRDEDVNRGFKSLIMSLKEDTSASSDEEDKDVRIQIANRIFVGPVYPIKSSFLQDIRENFDADAEQVNFGNMESAARTINRWVRQETRDKIKEIVNPTMLNNQTVMVLANAIHFKGHWRYPFNPDYTTRSRFTTIAGYDAQVEMMRMDNPRRLQYGRLPELKAAAVALPYSSQRFSFIVVLPDPGESLKDVEARIQDGTLADIPSRLNQAWVDVKLPKGILESNIDLVASKAIKSLGMSSMTTEFAEFDNLSDERGVHVTNVIHKAFLETNEAGSEAAAASAIVAQARSLELADDVVKFIVDRPFLAYIYDAKTKTVLFIARKLM